jgi:hypothetical protein
MFRRRWPQDHATVDPHRCPGYGELDVWRRVHTQQGKAYRCRWAHRSRDLPQAGREASRDHGSLGNCNERDLAGSGHAGHYNARGAKLRVGDSVSTSIVLWTDTAPPVVTLTSEGRVRELTLWNCWRDHRGIDQAWVGNGGMRIAKLAGGTLRFSCNSRPIITFEDLVFDVQFAET